MKSPDRMFRVLVLGGIALTACGGATTAGSSDSGTGDGFPQEGAHDAYPIDGEGFDAFPHEGPDAFTMDAGQDAGADGFPQEGARDASFEAFPTEGPDVSTIEAGQDASLDGGSTDGASAYDGFPQEGPVRIDF